MDYNQLVSQGFEKISHLTVEFFAAKIAFSFPYSHTIPHHSCFLRYIDAREESHL